MNKINLLNLVAFCILMENEEGIIEKSPDYILEKFKRYIQGDDHAWMWGLDKGNYEKLKRWAKRWQGIDL